MTVGTLIQELQKFDQKLEVIFYTEDEDLVTRKKSFQLLDYLHVECHNVERHRAPDGTPGLKFGNSDQSERMVLTLLTKEF